LGAILLLAHLAQFENSRLDGHQNDELFPPLVNLVTWVNLGVWGHGPWVLSLK
jgi:hypothetical protein